MKTWTLMGFTGAKMHVAPLILVVPVVDDLEVRGGGQACVQALRPGTFHLDHGGPMLTSRSYQAVDIDGLDLAVPTTEVGRFYHELWRARVRQTNGVEYFKLHGWLHALALTPAQRARLLLAWCDILMRTQEQVMAEDMRFAAAMRGMNAHPNIHFRAGTLLPVAN